MAEAKTFYDEMPDVSTLTKMYFSKDEEGTDVTQICLTESIPALEEAPEQITGSAVDIDYEFSRPGKVKAGTIEVPVYYTHKQHKWLKEIERQDGYFIVVYPKNTAPAGEKPLVKKFQGSLVTVGDELSDEEWIKDTVTIYRTSKVEESYEDFPPSA